MSVKLDGIDLNYDIDSIEANNDAGLNNRLGNETLIKNYGDQGDVGGVSVDVARVLGEGNGTLNVRGLANEVLNSEVGAVDTNGGLEAERVSLNIESELKEKNLENEEGVIGDETQKCDVNLYPEIKRAGNGEVEVMTERRQNQGRGINVLTQNAQAGAKVDLLVDLNLSHQSHGEIIFDNVSNGSRGNECLIESNLPVSVGLIESTATITEAAENGNPTMLIKDKIITAPAENMDVKDVKHGVLMPKVRGKESQTEKEGEYYVSDLVWAKVRSHPWWPGQIFEPSAASKKAMEHIKKDGYLIAYFGDQTFAWNEAPKIKPFHMYFSQMERQSKAETFSHALDCALNEVSRRTESGLACQCLKEEVLASVNSQVVVSAGIQEQSSRICGADSFSTAGFFLPENLVNYFKSLAEAPNAAIDRLEFVKARAQFLAFNRWKGYLQLPVFEEFDGILENDADPSGLQTNGMMQGVLGCNEDEQVLSGKAKSPVQNSFPKRKHMTRDDQCKKQKKHIMELVHGGSPSLPNGEKKSEGKASTKLPSGSSRQKRKVDDVVPNESRVKRTKGFSAEQAISETSSLPTDEMLSRLVIAAKNPFEGYNSLISIAGFFSGFRNLICMEYNNLQGKKKSLGKQKAEKSCGLESTGTFRFEGMEDSYWTDRIIESRLDEQVLFEPKTHTESNHIVAEPESVDRMNPNAVNDNEMNTMVAELDVENPSHIVDDKSNEYSPTLLILNFTSLESIPPITNLNGIFSRYGPLNVSETEVLGKSKRAKVVFKRRSDAETAFSSTGKFSIFGPSLVSYRLKYLPVPRKTSTASKTKGRRKKSTSAEQGAT